MSERSIKIEQWFQETLNVRLSQDIQERLNVNIDHLRPQSIDVKKIWSPVKVEVIKTPENDFLYYESKELAFTWKTLLSIWLIWIIYWTYNLKVNSFLWISINDSNNYVPWIIWILIIFECLIFCLIFLRDFFKDWVDKKILIKKNTERIKEHEAELKKEKITDEQRKAIRFSLNELKIENNKITLQNYQKNIIYYGTKIIVPLSVWLMWAVSIWVKKINEVVNIFPIEYTIIPISLMLILFILDKFKNNSIKE